MPTGQARRQTRRTQRRETLVLDAARAFAEFGYEQTSIPELAEELGMGVGSLYHYFGSKEQLLIAICDQLVDPLLKRAEGSRLDEDPVQGLHDLLRLWVTHVAEHRDHMLVFQQVRHLVETGDQWQAVRTSRKRFERLVDARLAEVEKAGLLTLSDRKLALRALLGMVNHTAQWYRPRGAFSASAIAEGYLGLVVRPAEERAPS